MFLKHDKFRNLNHNEKCPFKIHFGSAHPHNQKLIYYLCKDTLIFDTPTIQKKKDYTHDSLRYTDKNYGLLKRNLGSKLSIPSNNGDLSTLSCAGNQTLVNSKSVLLSNVVLIPTPILKVKTLKNGLRRK